MNTQLREVVRVVEPQRVMEGAGVPVRRTIGSYNLRSLDPFLLLDHFGSENPEDFAAGFPMHRHQQVQTVTYMIAGYMEHRDNTGGQGRVGPGGIQIMTAGSGIRHSEMPQAEEGRMEGFQLWVEPPPDVQRGPPHYQGVPADRIPEVALDVRGKVRIVAGAWRGTRNETTQIARDVEYLDVSLPPDSSFSKEIAAGRTPFAYVFEGQARFGGEGGREIAAHRLVVYGDGDHVQVRTTETGVRFLLVSGQPLR